METQVMIPDRISLREARSRETKSFTEALAFISSNNTEYNKLYLVGPFAVTEVDALEKIPQAFASNLNVRMLEFQKLEVKNVLVAEALRAAVGNNNVIMATFRELAIKAPETEIICQAFQQRTVAMQLIMFDCPPEFVKTIVESSTLKCFSLYISKISGPDLKMPLRKLFIRGTLIDLCLHELYGLEDSIFLGLSRCTSMMPRLKKLSLFNTNIRKAAAKPLYCAMKGILESWDGNTFEMLHLGPIKFNEQLTYSCFKLLQSDFIEYFNISVGSRAFSPAVVKHISSTVASTKNLRNLTFNRAFKSATEFGFFELQSAKAVFQPPFEVLGEIPEWKRLANKMSQRLLP